METNPREARANGGSSKVTVTGARCTCRCRDDQALGLGFWLTAIENLTFNSRCQFSLWLLEEVLSFWCKKQMDPAVFVLDRGFLLVFFLLAHPLGW